jgi:hypothetical protein
MPSKKLTEAQLALSAAQARQRRAALGPPLSQTDADLLALAEVSPHDLTEMEAFVRDAAGQFGVDLLRAKREG